MKDRLIGRGTVFVVEAGLTFANAYLANLAFELGDRPALIIALIGLVPSTILTFYRGFSLMKPSKNASVDSGTGTGRPTIITKTRYLLDKLTGEEIDEIDNDFRGK